MGWDFVEDKSVHLKHAACFSVMSAIDSLVILLIQAGLIAVDGIQFWYALPQPQPQPGIWVVSIFITTESAMPYILKKKYPALTYVSFAIEPARDDCSMGYTAESHSSKTDPPIAPPSYRSSALTAIPDRSSPLSLQCLMCTASWMTMPLSKVVSSLWMGKAAWLGYYISL